MTRSILAVLGIAFSVAVFAAPGCKQTGVGDPCVPDQEFDVNFNGFDPAEVNVESKSYQCLTRLCLVNHFQGRVSCPYGQDTNGAPTNGATQACAVPGGDPANAADQIQGNGTSVGKAVAPWCLDRSGEKTVYCSCRCQNLQGKTDDGANYCTCPDGFTCTQLVTSIGAGDTGLTGGYCVINKTQFTPGANCTSTCNASDPTALGVCGHVQGI